MKNINEYILESTEKFIEFAGDVLNIEAQQYKLDTQIKVYAKSKGKQAHDIEYNASFKSITDLVYDNKHKDLFSQGCKWIIAYPPHEGSGGDVDYYSITMFVSSKKIHDQYINSDKQVVINTKTAKIENEKTIKQTGKDWKIIRLN